MSKIRYKFSLSLIILFTNVQNKNIYTYIKVQQVKESNRGKLNSHIKTALQNEKIKQLRTTWICSRLSVSNALDIQYSRSYHFLIYSSFYLVGLARGTDVYGVQLAWGFSPRCKWTYGEVFHPAVVPRPHFSQLVIQFFGAECYQDCIVLFYDMSYILQSFRRINRALGLKRAALNGCGCFLVGSN